MGFQQKEIEIIQAPSQENPFVIINKPQGLASAPLFENDIENAYKQAEMIFPQLQNIAGRKQIEHGLLHRLDTETSGLLLIASTQEAYDFFQEQQAKGLFIKTYSAECDFNQNNTELLGAFPNHCFNIEPQKKIQVSSYFRNYGQGHKEVRPVTENSGKAALKKLGKPVLYTTEIILSPKDDYYLATCTINAGYRHQVRSHLSWLNYPIKGDSLYNCQCKDKTFLQELKFSATKLQFIHPLTGKTTIIEI